MANEQHREKNKREFYRIRYPLNFRPILKLAANAYEVIDISEKGIKFFCKKLYELKSNIEVEFKITFHDNESLNLKGKILRVDEHTVVIYLREAIPFGRIVQEQRYVRDKDPDNSQL